MKCKVKDCYQLATFERGEPTASYAYDWDLGKGSEAYYRVKGGPYNNSDLSGERLAELGIKVVEGKEALSIAVVGIGKDYTHQMEWLLNSSTIPEWIKNKLRKGEYEHYDMRTLPEKGDVLDNLDKHSAILGVHLFGVSDKSIPDTASNYFYNRENASLLSKAHRKDVPVYLFGEQPTGKNVTEFVEYLPTESKSKEKRSPL